MSNYVNSCNRLRALIPEAESRELLNQLYCELEPDFLGFCDIYEGLAGIIPPGMTVIDFGCYMAPQAYFFQRHKAYIGVDTCGLKRFTPSNAKHYVCSIQDFIRDEYPKLQADLKPTGYFAICSYVPDMEAAKLVRETFGNVFCYYPSAGHDPDLPL